MMTRDERAQQRWAARLQRMWVTRPDAIHVISHLYHSVRSDGTSRIKETWPVHYTAEQEPVFERSRLLADLHSLAQAAGASTFTITDQISGQTVRVYAVVSEYGHDENGDLIAPVSGNSDTLPPGAIPAFAGESW